MLVYSSSFLPKSDFDFDEKMGSSEKYVVPTNTTFVDIKELYKR